MTEELYVPSSQIQLDDKYVEARLTFPPKVASGERTVSTGFTYLLPTSSGISMVGRVPGSQSEVTAAISIVHRLTTIL